MSDAPRSDSDEVSPPRRRAAAVRRRVRVLGVIFLGGTLGTFTRAALEAAFPAQPDAIPWTTLAINIGGSFLLGLLLEALARTGSDSGWRRTVRLGVGTGVLGGFTTYSTFAVETVSRLNPAAWPIALAYAAASVVLGLLAAAAGYRLAHGLGRRQSAGGRR